MVLIGIVILQCAGRQERRSEVSEKEMFTVTSGSMLFPDFASRHECGPAL